MTDETRKQALRDFKAELPAPGNDPAVTARIAALDCSELTRAGLYLVHGDWDAAHRTVQSLPGAVAAHWHGIVHRQEPDHGNAKYWFRQVGSSPVFEALADRARTMGREALVGGADGWDPLRFVDCCADPANRDWCTELERVEMDALLDYCIEMEG